MRLSKNRKAVVAKMAPGTKYGLLPAMELVKDMTYTKFDASVDMDIRLGVDPRKANENVRGVHGAHQARVGSLYARQGGRGQGGRG